MPKRIYIKDGGLTASSPVPSGFTLLGSESGEVKKQVDTTITSLGGGSLGYKVYSALLTQSGFSAPTATVMENTLNITPSFSYYDNPGTFETEVGTYIITASGAFTSGKTVVLNGNSFLYTNGLLRYSVSSPDDVYIYTFQGNVLSNGVLNNTFIEIRVYD